MLCLREGYSWMFFPIYFFKINAGLLSQRENLNVEIIGNFVYAIMNAV